MQTATWTLAMGANLLYYMRSSDYFGTDHSQEPLLHCWSLAVEEQFYLVRITQTVDRRPQTPCTTQPTNYYNHYNEHWLHC